MERHVQGNDIVKGNTSWGKYTLGIVLLKFDPRHSNNVGRLKNQIHLQYRIVQKN